MQDTFTLADGTVCQVADFEFGFTLEGKAQATEQDDGSLIIEGYASDFGVDRQDEAFEPGAFDTALQEYMGNNPVILYHHKYDTAMGKALDARVDTKGLWIRAQLDKPEPGTPEAGYFNKVKNGVIRGFSVGGKFFRRMTDAGARIFKCDLREISITPMPVNSRTLFAVAGKAFDNMDTPTIEQTEVTFDLDELALRLDRIGMMLDGKASQHPDGPKIAALQYHLQNIHTLAMDTKQDSQSDDVKAAANDIAKHVSKHLKTIHHLAAQHGPLPNVYGGTIL